MAVSINSFEPQHWETAALVARVLIDGFQRPGPEPDLILNVNVPDLPFDALRGFRATRLGHRHKAEPVFRSQDPRGSPIYWVGPPGGEQDAGPGTDFLAVREGYVSVTPLQVDLTRHAVLSGLQDWLAGFAG